MESNNLLHSTFQTLVETKHAHGILYHILGLGELSRRISAIAAQHYNRDSPQAPAFFHAFVQSYYLEGDHKPRIPLVHNAIAFYAQSTAPQASSQVAHTYSSDSGQRWHIIDVETNDLSLIVPLRVYVPYRSCAPGRSALVLDNIRPLPFWIVRSGGLGVPLASNDLVSLRNQDWRFTNIDGRMRSTVMVKIEWPGYPRWQSQIRMRLNNLSGESYTFKRLVRQVLAKIRKFIAEHMNVVSEEPHWAVGEAGGGRITAHDLVLLGIIEVSRGAVMPILKLRDDFVFADSIPTPAAPITTTMVPPFDPQGAFNNPIPAFPSGADVPDIDGLDQLAYADLFGDVSLDSEMQALLDHYFPLPDAGLATNASFEGY
ncbi:unnamed protein product [Peniophora sp. CBMAI 1063]|nr:unnamed protein product [Peniophora sp. CBMAI 1063]